MSDAKTFDLIVVGGGPGGYPAAERAAEAGLKTALFERKKLGGTCLNEGCIPTKSLLYSAKLYAGALHGEAYGVRGGTVALEHAAALARKDKVVAGLVAGVKAKLRAAKVEVIQETATIKGRTPEGFAVEAGGGVYHAEKLIIATGSESVVPPIAGVAEGLKTGFAVTSRELLDIQAPPKKLAVVGGGVIGLELADYFRTAGSEVVVVELLDKIAGSFDDEISGILQKELEQKGIYFKLGRRVTAVSAAGLTVESGDGREEIAADRLLLSVGRKPSIAGLGLESLGIEPERGAIVTDRHMQTGVAGVYAVGDVNGRLMLAHTAYREAEVAVGHIMGRRDFMRYNAIPSVIYTYPEAASVGETELTAREKGLPFRVKKLPLSHAGRYQAETERGKGLCKLLVNTENEKVLGIQLIGNYASEIILAAAIMVETGLPESTFREVVFPHPTVGEIIRESMFA